MIIVGCPGCGWPLVLPDLRLGIVHLCYNCDHPFETRTAPILSRKGPRSGERPTPPTPAPGEAGPAVQTRLTAAHCCTQCREALPATGLRRSSLVCPSCKQTTSVYAVLHYCPECPTLLESPLSRQGGLGRCPACREHLTIPYDVLFNDGREPPDPTWYAFDCPSCRQTLRSKPADANKSAVCPFCRRSLTIPAAGEPVVPQIPATIEDVSAALESEIVRHCPQCGLQVAARARACQSCGAQVP